MFELIMLLGLSGLGIIFFTISLIKKSNLLKKVAYGLLAVWFIYWLIEWFIFDLFYGPFVILIMILMKAIIEKKKGLVIGLSIALLFLTFSLILLGGLWGAMTN